MNRSKFYSAISAMLMATFFVGEMTPVSATPIGTKFDFVTTNFQGDGGRTDITFGVPTFVPGSGVVIDSSVSTSPAIPGLTVGGLDFVEFEIHTDDGGFLNGDSASHSSWFISGLDWGPGSLPGVAAGLIFLSFDIDGVFVDLDGTALGVPVVPSPVSGAPSVPLDIAGDPVDIIPFDTEALTGETLLTTLLALGLSFGDALSVNSMHVGFEVTHIPEPGSLMLLGCGLATLVSVRRRKQ